MEFGLLFAHIAVREEAASGSFPWFWVAFGLAWVVAIIVMEKVGEPNGRAIDNLPPGTSHGGSRN